jgi:hypothetical protein
MTNLIIIKGSPYDNVKNSLELWMGSYADNPDLNGYTFELYTRENDEFVIKADEKLSNGYFNYLVNYLTYPEGLEGRMNVIGYTIISDTKIFSTEAAGTEIMLFIPEDDKDHDNVYWVTRSGQTYITDFGDRTIRINTIKKFQEQIINLSELESPETFTSKYEKEHEPEVIETEEDRTKWVKFLVILTIIGILLSLVFYSEPSTFTGIVEVIGMGLTLWFFIDYKTLQTNKLYNYCLATALGLSLFGYIIARSNIFYRHFGNIQFMTALPIIFLVCQKAARLSFIKIFNREPEIEKPVKTFADFIYLIVLVGGIVLLSLLLF